VFCAVLCCTVTVFALRDYAVGFSVPYHFNFVLSCIVLPPIYAKHFKAVVIDYKIRVDTY